VKRDLLLVVASGDMAYGVGTNQVTLNDPSGNRVTEQGRAATVWRKGADGRWKCVLDIWNPAPSAPPAGK
jgi:ketosteroid isomerase-like protein